jgi:hypothetical protein
MTVYRDIPHSRWLVPALLAAVAQYVIAPSDAHARCGDYVMLGGHAAQSDRMATENSDHMANVGYENQAAVATHSGPIQRGHCSGPNCSNDNSRPLEDPAAPVETEFREWGLVAVRWLRAQVVARFSRFADDATLPQIVAGSVYRPPR